MHNLRGKRSVAKASIESEATISPARSSGPQGRQMEGRCMYSPPGHGQGSGKGL